MTTATPGEWQTTGGDQSCSGSCPSGACTTSCTNMHAGPAGTGPVSAYSYNITSPHGASYMTAVTPQSFVCSASGPLNLGQTLSWSGVHFHVGSLTLSITGSVGSWDVSGGPGYTKTGAGGSVTIADVPSLGSENYTVKITAAAGQIVCVSNNPITSCLDASFSGTTRVGVGGSLGPDVISDAFTVPHHGTKTVYIRSQATTAPVGLAVTTANPSKLYTPLDISFTGGAPRAYVFIVSQKSGGTSEGNPDPAGCGSFTNLTDYQSVAVTNTAGAYTGSPFTLGDAGPVLNANAIGCWRFSVRVAGLTPSPLSYLPVGGLQVPAGTLLARATVNNGGSDGLEDMSQPPTPATWHYESSTIELCGASECNLAGLPYTANPLKGSGGASKHRITLGAVAGVPPYAVAYPNADLLNWLNKEGCDQIISTAKNVGEQTVPAPGCSGADRGVLEYRPNFVNTRIRVKAIINGGAAAGALPASTGGSPLGDGDGSVTFPPGGQYTITGPETRTGNTAEGLHWGMTYQ